MNIKQIKLDKLLFKYKAQPVSSGYIDVVVNRGYYQDLIVDCIYNNYDIIAISWWEYCAKIGERKFGMGGPKSYYFDGWFAEICTEDSFDQLDLLPCTPPKEKIDIILSKIESKVFKDFDDICFLESKEIIPALWFNLPDFWENSFI